MDQENKVSNLKIFFFYLWIKLEGVDFDLNTLFDLAHHIVKKGLMNWPIMMHIVIQRYNKKPDQSQLLLPLFR